ESEHARTQHLQPKAERRFVDADKAHGIKRGKQERMPVLEHAPYGGCVIGVTETFLIQSDEVEERAAAQDQADSEQFRPSQATRYRDGHACGSGRWRSFLVAFRRNEIDRFGEQRHTQKLASKPW